MLTETHVDLHNGMVAIVRENDEIRWPYIARNYAILVDGFYVSMFDKEGTRTASDTYDISAKIWERIYKKAKEIQHVQPT
jgi:hypothetical protein